MRTHSVKVDDFVPDPNYKKPQGQNPAQQVKVNKDPFANVDDSLPF